MQPPYVGELAEVKFGPLRMLHGHITQVEHEAEDRERIEGWTITVRVVHREGERFYTGFVSVAWQSEIRWVIDAGQQLRSSPSKADMNEIEQLRYTMTEVEL